MEHTTSTLDSKLPKGGMGGPGGHFGWMGMTETQDAAAKALGITTDKLHTALQSGKSLADVARDQKVTVSSLVMAMVAATQDRLAAAVKAGTITQQQADAMKGSLTERITDRVNGVRSDHGPGHRPGHGRGHGSGGPGMAPSTDDTADSSPSTSLSVV